MPRPAETLQRHDAVAAPPAPPARASTASTASLVMLLMGVAATLVWLGFIAYGAGTLVSLL
jgi:hypothetical protein